MGCRGSSCLLLVQPAVMGGQSASFLTKTKPYFWPIPIARFRVAKHMSTDVNCVRAVLPCKSVCVEA